MLKAKGFAKVHHEPIYASTFASSFLRGLRPATNYSYGGGIRLGSNVLTGQIARNISRMRQLRRMPSKAIREKPVFAKLHFLRFGQVSGWILGFALLGLRFLEATASTSTRGLTLRAPGPGADDSPRRRAVRRYSRAQL